MRILALMASPRKGSNTDILTDQVLAGAARNGHESEKIPLYGLDIAPCVDCRACKKDPFLCPVDDAMQEVYAAMDRADLLLFATPVYWFGPTAVMKLVVDRMRPYAASRGLVGKGAAVVAPAGDGHGDCDLLLAMFDRTFAYLGIADLGSVTAKAYDRAEIRQDPETLARARSFGGRL